MSDQEGRDFRAAWIAGVKKHYPGEPKPGYIAPWDETPDWERRAAAAVYGQVRDFIAVSDGNAAKLTRKQKGRFVSLCWIAQIYKHFADPKPSYVADWDDQPEWQRTPTRTSLITLSEQDVPDLPWRPGAGELTHGQRRSVIQPLSVRR